MPEELPSGEQTQLASATPEELPEAKKIHLAVAIAQGNSVDAWARNNGVPRSTAFRWAAEPEVRRAVESHRRRTRDRAIGRLNRRMIWASDRIAQLASAAESESVQLRALRAIFSEEVSVSKFSNLEFRMSEIEEDLRDRTGNPDDVG